MNLLVFLLFGALAGWIASLIMGTNSKQGLLGDVLLGIVGSFLGGYLFSLFGQPGVAGFDIYSILVAVVGSVVVIYIGRLLSGIR